MTEVVVLRPGETFARKEGKKRWRRNNGPAIWTQTGPTHFVCFGRLDKKTADEGATQDRRRPVADDDAPPRRVFPEDKAMSEEIPHVLHTQGYPPAVMDMGRVYRKVPGTNALYRTDGYEALFTITGYSGCPECQRLIPWRGKGHHALPRPPVYSTPLDYCIDHAILEPAPGTNYWLAVLNCPRQREEAARYALRYLRERDRLPVGRHRVGEGWVDYPEEELDEPRYHELGSSAA
jgi:hypothetical protein